MRVKVSGEVKRAVKVQEREMKDCTLIEKVRVRLSKIEVRCGSACGSIIEVRVCVRHKAKYLATQRLVVVFNLMSRLYQAYY